MGSSAQKSQLPKNTCMKYEVLATGPVEVSQMLSSSIGFDQKGQVLKVPVNGTESHGLKEAFHQ